MTNKRSQLADRRKALVIEAAKQRMQLTAVFEPLRAPLTLADQGLNAVRYIAKHPVVLAAVVALAVVVRPGRWYFLMEGGWTAWRIAVAAKRNLESSD